METALIFSQIVFNLVVSIVIIALGILMAIVAYHLIKIAKELEQISHNFHETADEAGERIKEILEKLSNLPILSYFLKHNKSHGKSNKRSS